MTHYGIWLVDIEKWAVTSDGVIFSTTSKYVAKVQLQYWYDNAELLNTRIKGAEVREFPDE